MLIRLAREEWEKNEYDRIHIRTGPFVPLSIAGEKVDTFAGADIGVAGVTDEGVVGISSPGWCLGSFVRIESKTFLFSGRIRGSCNSETR